MGSHLSTHPRLNRVIPPACAHKNQAVHHSLVASETTPRRPLSSLKPGPGSLLMELGPRQLRIKAIGFLKGNVTSCPRLVHQRRNADSVEDEIGLCVGRYG